VRYCDDAFKVYIQTLIQEYEIYFFDYLVVASPKHKNVVGTNACGINAIQFKSYNQFLNDLKDYSVMIPLHIELINKTTDKP